MKQNTLLINLQQVKEASSVIAKLTGKQKRTILLEMVKELLANKETILAANKKDVAETKKKNVTGAFLDRLTLTDKGFEGMVAQLKIVANLPDAIGEIIEERTLPNALRLVKRRFPIGVIFMIYESRPNVTVDVAGLCLKSGNAVLLKGGSESYHTNKALMKCLHAVLLNHNVPTAGIMLLENVTHQEVNYLLKQKDYIDVVIPRGSYGLTTAVANNARIPILYHASGGARMYVDKSADLAQALSIAVNAKTQRTGVCNALDAVLVHKEVIEQFLPQLDEAVAQKGFAIRADERAKRLMPHAVKASKKDFATEFLDSILAVKVVNDAQEALQFIREHTHNHTEVLIAEDEKLIETFINEIDAAGLMINCSSRLHDGGEFGMGAEMGTATGKLHARGPVGVRELTTYKWIAYGDGQIRQ